MLRPTKVVSRAISAIGKDPIETARGPTFISTRNHNKEIGVKPLTNPAAQIWPPTKPILNATPSSATPSDPEKDVRVPKRRINLPKTCATKYATSFWYGSLLVDINPTKEIMANSNPSQT